MLSDITRDERRDRVSEIREWLQETYYEFQDQEFPPYIQRQWDLNCAELLDHERHLRNIEERERWLAEMRLREYQIMAQAW